MHFHTLKGALKDVRAGRAENREAGFLWGWQGRLLCRHWELKDDQVFILGMCLGWWHSGECHRGAGITSYTSWDLTHRGYHSRKSGVKTPKVSLQSKPQGKGFSPQRLRFPCHWRQMLCTQVWHQHLGMSFSYFCWWFLQLFRCLSLRSYFGGSLWGSPPWEQTACGGAFTIL